MLKDLRRFVRNSAFIAVLTVLFCNPLPAAQVFLYGIVKDSTVNTSIWKNQSWSLIGDYTPNASGKSAAFSSVTLRIGSVTWSNMQTYNPTYPQTFSGMTHDPNGRLVIASAFNPPSNPSGYGTSNVNFALTIDGTGFDNTTNLTEDNVLAILRTAPMGQQGSISITDSITGVGSVTESLTTIRTVPEPTTWAVLAGVATCSAHRLLRRRRISA